MAARLAGGYFFFGGFLKSDSKKKIYHVFSQNLPKKDSLWIRFQKKKFLDDFIVIISNAAVDVLRLWRP